MAITSDEKSSSQRKEVQVTDGKSFLLVKVKSIRVLFDWKFSSATVFGSSSLSSVF